MNIRFCKENNLEYNTATNVMAFCQSMFNICALDKSIDQISASTKFREQVLLGFNI